MKIKVKGKMRISDYENVLLVPFADRTSVIQLLEEQETAKHPYLAEIKQDRPKKTLSQNGYFWALVDKLAECPDINTSSDEVYARLVTRYGIAEEELLSVIEEAADMVYRITEGKCREVGEGVVNGKTFKHFRVYIGISKYDTKQMNRMIDGVRSECQEVGIPVETPAELAVMKEEWSKKE